jgi:hypothetical protein
MRTSKIPAWPEDIEAACAVDPNDPYIRDASNNPEAIPMDSVKDGATKPNFED